MAHPLLLRDFSAKPSNGHGVITKPPPVQPFLLTQNQSPKDTAGSDFTNC